MSLNGPDHLHLGPSTPTLPWAFLKLSLGLLVPSSAVPCECWSTSWVRAHPVGWLTLLTAALPHHHNIALWSGLMVGLGHHLQGCTACLAWVLRDAHLPGQAWGVLCPRLPSPSGAVLLQLLPNALNWDSFPQQGRWDGHWGWARCQGDARGNFMHFFFSLSQKCINSWAGSLSTKQSWETPFFTCVSWKCVTLVILALV